MLVRIVYLVIISLLLGSILIYAESMPNIWPQVDVYLVSQEWKRKFESKDDSEVDLETQIRINKVREALRLTDPDTFGGYYIGANQNYTHINIVKGKEEMILRLDDEYIIYHMVDYTLSELEGVHQLFIPYMEELKIQSLSVNVPLNKVEVAVYNPLSTFLEDIAKVGVDTDMYFIVFKTSPIVLL